MCFSLAEPLRLQFPGQFCTISVFLQYTNINNVKIYIPTHSEIGRQDDILVTLHTDLVSITEIQYENMYQL